MAQVDATISFALPEDTEADLIELYSSETRDGSYSLVEQSEYQYGMTQYEPQDFDDGLWYRIRFVNSSEATTSSLSDPVFGGQFSDSAPFLSVSTTTDGANYATTQDVYDYSGLTSEDVATARVSSALKRARAVIDFRTAEMGIERFDSFDTDTARRKYNASLRILKEAEINIALGNLYQNMSDDRIIENAREGTHQADAISIGDTSISGADIADRHESIVFLATLASRYFAQGEFLLASLDANSIRLSYGELSRRFPQFKFPFHGWG